MDIVNVTGTKDTVEESVQEIRITLDELYTHLFESTEINTNFSFFHYWSS